MTQPHARKYPLRKFAFLLVMIMASTLALSEKSDTVVRGPYLQMGTPDQVTVRWRSDVDSISQVIFGTTADNLDQIANITGIRTDHSVTLTGLTPNTRYYYKVQAGSFQIGDSGYSFRTAPEPGANQPLRIWAIGDSGTANNDARAVRDAYKNLPNSDHTDVWLMLGDNAYDDGTDSEYQAAVFDTYPEILKKTILWPTIGNHDGHSADSASQSGPYFDIFDLPTNGEAGGVPSGTEAYYSFDYANIHFICLDSYETSRSTSGTMHSWLEFDLAANTQPWIIAFWHHPPYSKGSHDSDTEAELIDMRENFNPLLEEYGVDLVLSGHSHSYERSYLIDGHYSSSGSFDGGHLVDGGNGQVGGDGAYEKDNGGNQGAVYLVAGSSGKISNMKGLHPVMIASNAVLGSMVLDVDGNRLDARFVDHSGSILDEFTINKGAETLPSQHVDVFFDAAADVNVGSSGSRNNSTTVNADGADAGEDIRALFKWSPTGLASGTEVTRASVRFDVVNTSTGSYNLYTLNNPWTEADADWSNTTVLGSSIGSLSPSSLGSHRVTLNSDGIQAVQAWVDGGINNGLVLVSTGTADGVDITSREGGNAAVLEISYALAEKPAPVAPGNLTITFVP